SLVDTNVGSWKRARLNATHGVITRTAATTAVAANALRLTEALRSASGTAIPSNTTNNANSTRASPASPHSTPSPAARRFVGRSHSANAHNIAPTTASAVTVSDITSPSLIHTFGEIAAIAAATSPT